MEVKQYNDTSATTAQTHRHAGKNSESLSWFSISQVEREGKTRFNLHVQSGHGLNNLYARGFGKHS